jgi:aminomethyltransferase
MGQVTLTGTKHVEFMEYLTVCDIQGLKPNNAKLTVMTNERGGVIDDCIVTRRENDLYVVLNAGCKDKDMAHIKAQMKAWNAKHPSDEPVAMKYHENRSLVALQGPKAVDVMKKLLPDADFVHLPFMGSLNAKLKNIPVHITRCGYTGEDGFEIGCDNEFAVQLWDTLLSDEVVRPAGLGVRDSLRLEAGLCLYGNELDEDTTPIDAGLKWLIAPRCEKAGSFIGSEAIIEQIAGKNLNKRLRGVEILGGAPARHGATLHDKDGKQVGVVTSGGPAPSLDMKKIALGYLEPDFWKAGTEIQVNVRGKLSPAVVKPPSFVKGNYYRVPTTQ